MAQSLLIHGGKPLEGTIDICGAKNAALPILAATLLTTQPCTITNIPYIKDVERMIEMIRSLGADVQWEGKRELTICAAKLDEERFRRDIVPQLRASVLLIGPLLARFGYIDIPYPGGDQIGARPIDVHLDGFVALGVSVQEHEQGVRLQRPEDARFKTSHLTLKEFSVTATENLLLYASTVPWPLTISLAAAEPHVEDLCRFLEKLGVRIIGRGTHTVTLCGTAQLGGARHALIPDTIEAGTMLIGGAATRGEVEVRGVTVEHLLAVIEKLKAFGAALSFPRDNSILVTAKGKLTGNRVQVLPHPGIPSDLQAPFGILGTQADGTTHIHDPLYEGRFRYIGELKRMGARAYVANPHEAYIMGPAKLFGVEIPALDIRSGAALILAGLLAEGETVIHDAEIIDRGYEHIEERLRALGADIQRVDA